jgi:hypothetical protein
LFTRERRRTRIQNFLLRYEGKTEQKPFVGAIFPTAKPVSAASQTRTAAPAFR